MAARPPLEARHSWHLGDMLDLNKAANQHPEEEKQDQDWDALAKALAEIAKDWLPKYFPNGRIQGNELRLGSIDGRAPTGQGSVKIDFKGPHAGSWKDFAASGSGTGGGPNSTLMHATGLRGVDLYAEGCKIVGYDPATRAPRKANGNGSGGHAAPRRTTAERNQALASFEWEGAHRSLAGTLAEVYLNARGLLDPESESLRYAASCAHPDTRTGMPCIIARWRSPVTGEPLGGIHRTYLRQDGSWHVGRDGLKAKMSLGPSDGIVMLGGPTAVGDLIVGEGLETTLAGAALYDHPLSACWYGGTGGMLRLAALFAGGSLPAALTGDIKRVLILKDHGEDGTKAAHALAEAIEKAGIEAWIATPNSDPAGKEDFADDIAASRGRTQHVRYNAVQRGTQENSIIPITYRLGKLIEDFNNQYAVVNEAGKAFVYEQSYDPIRQRNLIVRIAFSDFKKFYQNYRITIQNKSGKSETKTAANWWLDDIRRRQYLKGVVFDPTNKVDKKQYWNLWQGFSVEPKKGDWSLMKDHILNVICSGEYEHYEYLIGWMARAFQYPQIQGEVAVVIRGEKGSGKGTLATWLVKAWGQHGLHIHSSKHLVGNFNLHLRDAVLLFADEAFFAGDKSHEPVLKGLITDPTITIEGKNQNIVECVNMLHVIMASNSDWVVPATQKERRYLVLDVNDNKVGNRKYFADLYHQMENGGLAAMIYDMLNHSLDSFEVRDIPQTKALTDQKNQSLDTLDRWIRDILERGFVFSSKYGVTEFKYWMEWVSRDLMILSYQQWCSKNRISYPSSGIMLSKRLRSIYPFNRSSHDEIIGEVEAIVSNSIAGTSDPVIRKSRPDGFRMGDLDTAREAFAHVRGVTIDATPDE